MRPVRTVLALAILLFARTPSADANLLRNGSFQDDWLTLLPENQNHHWCYSTGFQNRRDYNPDSWFLSGNWKWINADGPPGSRRIVLEGPRSEALQRINWVLVHDDRSREGFPDAGGFPAPALQSSTNPLSLVRDLTLRVRVRGESVPKGGAVIELGLSPPGTIAANDPMGTRLPLTTSASLPLPSGTFSWQWVEVRLPATQWLKAAREAKADGQEGTALPGVASVAVRYSSPTGHIEIERAELAAAEPGTPNLLPDGGFEAVDASGWPTGWSHPEKYRYFPPALYYLFNTWHNTTADNRGVVARDALVPRTGAVSLKMIVPSGDEVQVASAPIMLNQAEPRLIEVSVWVKTDQINVLQIDGLSDTGERLDGFNFIHKAPLSIGTDEWRQLRQVFKPRRPVRSLRLVLAARGVNGYTLGDTGETPQASATGTIWWDDARVFETESTAAELRARGVKAVVSSSPPHPAPYLQDLDPGERRFGANSLKATVVNVGAPRTLSLVWRFTTVDGRKSETRSAARALAPDERGALTVPYELLPSTLSAYSEHRGELSLVDQNGKAIATSALWFSTWSTPIDLELGALYLAPEQKLFVRMNLGFSSETMASLASVRLEVIRRRSGEVLKSRIVAATPRDMAAQRERIPVDLREDFTNLLLTELDVSDLPVQPFASPERNWLVRASVLDQQGRKVFSQDSPPFCRQAHAAKQAGVGSVRIDRNNLLYVNDQPFLPWGAAYGHVPVFDGSSGRKPATWRDLRNLPAWSIYDGFTAATYNGSNSGFNTIRYVAGAIADPIKLAKAWNEDNKMAASAFITKGAVFSPEELAKSAGGAAALAANLAFMKTAPMVVSVAPGIEEAFGLFHSVTPAQVAGLEGVVDSLRQATGKPVMVGHGGYWNRFEFERVPFFDIYDPETEPLYPANLHTDLSPLITGKEKTIWLRPQMYEDVPYERWRFHVYVELMRGARGFQIAHGPGDASLFRGLGGELEGLKPVLWSSDAGPEVRISPAAEHWVRREKGRTTIMAATTRGLTFGKWRWQDGASGPHGRARVTESGTVARDEANAYGIGETRTPGPGLHGIQYLPEPRRYSKGARLVQWVWLDPKASPRNLAILAKGDGRFTHAASWGTIELGAFRRASGLEWFLNGFYRHARGFLGWGKDLLTSALAYVPERTRSMGALPPPGAWVRLEVPLADLGAQDKLLDGVGFLHEGGRVLWGQTTIEEGPGSQVLWGDSLAPTPTELEKTRIEVSGLKAGVRIKVLFEDREIVAAAGYFVDDFRGRDLYQRFGGGPGVGYGNEPVAFHLYEIP